ncbi:hypothetical protein [Metamycoplasma hyosynoviae]|nr:hypothetical protein [Metamycoplasma hyosynoviae]MDD1373094.1 hypothetical protein [Metamycoplasma hyosynoviae]MDD7894107.1 hypothetical protein [Metamycoplasma hyosynoviae]MDD7894752.1 hypothetical protein [Metamycoplasma hyosynoviae]MDD7896069.1 hypothetical protein [Metamycoplasma hyosynoviae]
MKTQFSKKSLSHKMAIIIGSILVILNSLILINDFLFHDTQIFQIKKIGMKVFKTQILFYLFRFTFITVHINAFMAISLLIYGTSKKYQFFARRLLTFAMTYFILGIIIYWSAVSFELHARFDRMQEKLPNHLQNKKFYQYFHIYFTHMTTFILGFVGYGFAKNDLIFVKRDIWNSTVYSAMYLLMFTIIYSIIFSNGYNKTPGSYADKMLGGHKEVAVLYQFIALAKPLFMDNPDPNIPIWLTWAKVIIIDLIIFACIILGTTLIAFCLQKFFKIKTFTNEKEYRKERDIFYQNYLTSSTLSNQTENTI